jgi:hypothetical protein
VASGSGINFVAQGSSSSRTENGGRDLDIKGFFAAVFIGTGLCSSSPVKNKAFNLFPFLTLTFCCLVPSMYFNLHFISPMESPGNRFTFSVEYTTNHS